MIGRRSSRAPHSVRRRAERAALVRLAKAAARFDDLLSCRLGAVVEDDTRRPIEAEFTAAVAAARPFVGLAIKDGGGVA